MIRTTDRTAATSPPNATVTLIEFCTFLTETRQKKSKQTKQRMLMQRFKLNVQVSDSKQEKDNNTGRGNCALMVLWFILHFGELILAAILKLNAKSEGAPDIWSSSV